MTGEVVPLTSGLRPLDYPEPPLPDLPPGPNPRQLLAHHLSPYCDELLFGGARGGGKTDFALAEALIRLHRVPGMQGVIFRRTYRELALPGGIMQRLFKRLPRSIARWRSQEKTWSFTNGSALTLAYLETESDVRAWLGQEVHLMLFEQVEQLEEQPYIMVRSSLRATGAVARRMADAGYRPSSIATANPGDVGHAWVKARFIDPFPTGQGQLFRSAPTEEEPEPMVRCFVKSLLSDNPALDRGDPTYRRRLEALPADDRAAHLGGDWNVYKGARFGMFRTHLHVVEPEDLPIPPGAGIARGRGVDYGMENPFVCLWGARLADDLVVVYRELDGVGLTPTEQAQLILEQTSDEEEGDGRPVPTALDPSCWTAPPDQPPPRKMRGEVGIRREAPPRGSIAWTYTRAGLGVRRADNRRVEGATAVADRLKPRTDGTVRLVIYSTCTDLIRTLPALQRDPKRVEDVKKSDIDHWYDALRYLLGVLGFLAPSAPGPDTPNPHRPGAPHAAGITGAGIRATAAPPGIRGSRRADRPIRRAGF
jgi:hypothetical protein